MHKVATARAGRTTKHADGSVILVLLLLPSVTYNKEVNKLEKSYKYASTASSSNICTPVAQVIQQ